MNFRKNTIILFILTFLFLLVVFFLCIFGDYHVEFFIDQSGTPITADIPVIIYPYDIDPKKNDSILKPFLPKIEITMIRSEVHKAHLTNGKYIWEHAKVGSYWIKVNDDMQKITIAPGLQRKIQMKIHTKPKQYTIAVDFLDQNSLPVSNQKFSFILHGYETMTPYMQLSENGEPLLTNEKGQIVLYHVAPGFYVLNIKNDSFFIPVYANDEISVNYQFICTV